MNRKKSFVPSLFTIGNLFCGFMAIVYSIECEPLLAGWMVLVAALFDGLDGKVARFTNSNSKFGVELDSLADLVSFGIAPITLLYSHILQPLHHLGLILGFLFVLAGAVRLARFNIQQKGTTTKTDFFGLPIPVAGCVLAAYVIFSYELWDEIVFNELIILSLVLLSMLMVSTVRYPAFPKIAFDSLKSKAMLIIYLLAVIAIFFHPQLMFFPIFVFYIMYGVTRSFLNHIWEFPLLKVFREKF